MRDYEPLPLEATAMGALRDAILPHADEAGLCLMRLRDALDWVVTERGRGDLDAVKEASTELLLAVQRVDEELKRRVG